MNDNRMIRIMVFEPGRAPYTTMLEDSLEHRQELVGGDIECIPLPCETVLCCNASGKLTGLPENRQYGPDILHGTFFLYCDTPEGRGVSLTDEQIAMYQEYIVKQARFDERKNGGQTSNLYTLCSDLLCPDEPENAPVLEDDASDESPAVQPESAPADACNASDPTPGEQSATLPTADSYSFADGFETKIGRQFCRPIRMWTGGQSIFIPP